jgi:iron complex outermembrane receptor protein
MSFQATLRYRALASGVLLALAGSAASAQDAPVGANRAAIEEVVVTATKRETNLRDTPIAMSVMGDEQLKDRHVQGLLDLGDGSIPGLRVAPFESRHSAVTVGIRGIVPLDANQPAREQGVGVYLDGVYLGRQHGLNAALLDIERIEVLKGPQGTLFGRNTEGGAVSMVTKAPLGEFSIRGLAGASSYDGYNANLHMDLPEVANVSFKLDGVVQHQGAWTENPLPDEKGWGYFDRHGARAALRWQPSDNFRADFAYDTGEDATTPDYSQLINYNPLGLAIGPASGTLPAGQIRPLPSLVEVRADRMDTGDIGVPQQSSIDETDGASLNLSWQVAPDIELRSITASRNVNTTQWDNSGGAHRLPVFTSNGNFSRYSLAELDQNQVSQEFQIVGSSSKLDYVAGVYYFDEEAQDHAATPPTNQWNVDGTGYTFLDPTPTLPGHRVIDRASVAFATSYALYGQVTYTPAARNQTLHLTVGGRETYDEKNGLLFTVNNAPTDLTFDIEDDHFDPMVTFAIDATANINLYAKYASGYRAGGASSRSLTYRSFGPEEADSYEIGLKTLFAGKVRFDVAAYTMDRTGSQIDFSLVTPQPNGSTRNTLETINAPGTTKIKGLELEATAQLTANLSLTGAFAYTDAVVPPTVNPFNNQLQPVFIVFTPPRAASAGIDYETPMKRNGMMFRVHFDGNYSAAHHSFAEVAEMVDSSFVSNARLSFANISVGSGNNELTVSLWARNVFNEEHIYRLDTANRATLGDYANFSTPRMVGAEVSMSF